MMTVPKKMIELRVPNWPPIAIFFEIDDQRFSDKCSYSQGTRYVCVQNKHGWLGDEVSDCECELRVCEGVSE